MNTKYFALAALLISTGWSSQVVYKNHLSYMKSKAIVSRSIASQFNELNMSNIKDESLDIKEQVKKLTRSKEDLVLELKSMSLKDLAKDSREMKIQEIKEVRNQMRKRLAKAELFITKTKRDVSIEPKTEIEKVDDVDTQEKLQESDGIDDPEIIHKDSESASIESPEKDIKLISEVNDSLQASRKTLDEFNIIDFEITLDQAIEIAMQEKIAEQEKNLGDLNSRICSQNEKIESLTTKLEKLIKDKEKVVDELDENDKDKKKKSDKEVDIASLFNPAFFMNPSQFFAQGLFSTQQNSNSNSSFLNSSPQMGGMDMNFLMLTNLLGKNTGMGAFGGRTNITYSPVYYNNQGYSLPTSLNNLGPGNLNYHNGQIGTPNQGQQLIQNPFGLNQNNLQIPSYPRSNALQTNNTSTHNAMGIAPNSQAL